MKYLKELRKMIDEINDKGLLQDPAVPHHITITGERSNVIIYANAPVTICSCNGGHDRSGGANTAEQAEKR